MEIGQDQRDGVGHGSRRTVLQPLNWNSNSMTVHKKGIIRLFLARVEVFQCVQQNVGDVLSVSGDQH